MISIDKVIKSFKLELKEIYPFNEITAIAELAFEHFLHYSKTDLILKADMELSDDVKAKLKNTLERLKKHEPIQYILGETYFYNLKFKVQPGVLIPRQETEELVDWIIKENANKKHLKVLDIGTGSGCIAIALAANLNDAHVTAFDISDLAMEIASTNAKLNKLNIDFEKFDILKHKELSESRIFDIIISNPPYVLEKERTLMQKNVLDYEPSLALFVNDDDPLIYYRAIAEYSAKYLNTNGKLYFEINEAYGLHVEELLNNSGFGSVHLKEDINGKNRMISAIKL